MDSGPCSLLAPCGQLWWCKILHLNSSFLGLLPVSSKQALYCKTALFSTENPPNKEKTSGLWSHSCSFLKGPVIQTHSNPVKGISHMPPFLTVWTVGLLLPGVWRQTKGFGHIQVAMGNGWFCCRFWLKGFEWAGESRRIIGTIVFSHYSCKYSNHRIRYQNGV